MGTISKTVQHCIESFRPKQMRLYKLMWLGWGDVAEYFRESGMKYGTTELKVRADGKPQKHSTTATPSPTTFRELMRALDIVPRQSEMPQLTS
jgi:hypothetical protein